MCGHEWTYVCATESGASLPQSSRPLYELHLRRRQSRAHVAAGRALRSKLSAVYQRSDRLRANLARRRQQDRAAAAADHSWPNSLQAEHSGRRICPAGHPVQDEQFGTTWLTRYVYLLKK